ncbi:hypothetical protein JVT61DRAFT_2712 [Boletus reticuloceps]|nr:hypothetical protein JVT61DRAFT_2712 [Boletus reticuloceps]
MLPKRASPLQLFSNHIKFIVDRGRDVEAAVARSVDVLGIIAGFLGVRPSALESTLAYKTKLVKKELCTFFLDLDLSVLVHAFLLPVNVRFESPLIPHDLSLSRCPRRHLPNPLQRLSKRYGKRD